MSLQERYEEHHRERRDEGDFVFVPERIPLFQAAIGRGRRVLDLGCRSGALSRHFLDGNEVVGLDVDRVALAKAAELAESPLGFTGNSQLVGEALYTTYLLPFEIASILLLVAIVGAVALAKRKTQAE